MPTIRSCSETDFRPLWIVRFYYRQAEPDGNFLDYGFCKKKLKILYSYHEIRIPNSWFTEYIFYCLSFLAITYWQERGKNRHLESVNLTPIDILENSTETKTIFLLMARRLMFTVNKKKMSKVVVKMLKKYQICPTQIWLRMPMDCSQKINNSEVEWVGKTKQRFPESRYKMSYWFLFKFLVKICYQ